LPFDETRFSEASAEAQELIAPGFERYAAEEPYDRHRARLRLPGAFPSLIRSLLAGTSRAFSMPKSRLSEADKGARLSSF
jgi:hypothetical protein